jgi:hypothetical protein
MLPKSDHSSLFRGSPSSAPDPKASPGEKSSHNFCSIYSLAYAHGRFPFAWPRFVHEARILKWAKVGKKFMM